MEGSSSTGLSGCTANSPSLTMPIHTYAHTSGTSGGYSITGGYVYRGTAAPSLTGRYLYADWCTGQSWSIDAARPGAPQDLTREIGRIAGVNSFGEDRAGNVYVVTNRSVRRITG
jgi:hypothetical protein